MANTTALPILLPKQSSIIAVGVDRTTLQQVPGVLELIEITPRGLIVVNEDGTSGILTTPPMQLLAVLHGEEAVTRAAALVRWLSDYGAERPLVLHWRRGTETEALRHVSREMARRAQSSVARQRQTAAEVTRMRGINSELHHRFLVAESMLLRSGAMPLDIAFSNEPMTEPAHHLSLAETEAGAAQILPLASSGISAISIHCAAMAEPGTGHLMAQVTSLEDGRIIDRWSIRAAELVPGWNALALKRSISDYGRTVELRLWRRSAEDRLPAISLGGGQPVLAYQVRDVASGAPILRNSLALQIWRGLPGTALPGWFKAHQPRRSKSATGGYVDIPLAPNDLTQVQHANAEQVSFDFPAVLGPIGERAILCHAPTAGLTLARLPSAMPSGAVRFAATAFIDNQQSRDVDFALIIAADTAQARALAEGKVAPGKNDAFSGWCQVSSRQARRLSALREDPSGDGTFFVATRMSEAGDNSFARARFRDLSVMVQA